MLLRPSLLIASIFCCSAQAAEIKAVPLDRPGEGAIIIEGDIRYEDKDAFLTKIAPFSGGIVVFNSGGGSAYAGIAIGRTIRMRNFKTWVPSGSYCASACAAAWLGGSPRLMGKSALIGFHSVYKMEDGAPVQTGSGNALYGAYLSQLGLPERAIMYLSDAAPTSMNWLTPAQAEGFGIDLAVFDPSTSGTTAKTPLAQDTESLEMRSRNFVIALHVIVSGPLEQYLKIMNGLYSDPVSYYGKQVPRAEVADQIAKFLARWPIRSYTVRPESIKVQCNAQTSMCHVDGLIDFDAKSIARKQWSHGTATFEYLLAFHPNSRWPVIINENGSVVDRQVKALSNTLPSQSQNFGAAR